MDSNYAAEMYRFLVVLTQGENERCEWVQCTSDRFAAVCAQVRVQFPRWAIAEVLVPDAF